TTEIFGGSRFSLTGSDEPSLLVDERFVESLARRRPGDQRLAVPGERRGVAAGDGTGQGRFGTRRERAVGGGTNERRERVQSAAPGGGAPRWHGSRGPGRRGGAARRSRAQPAPRGPRSAHRRRLRGARVKKRCPGDLARRSRSPWGTRRLVSFFAARI